MSIRLLKWYRKFNVQMLSCPLTRAIIHFRVPELVKFMDQNYVN